MKKITITNFIQRVQQRKGFAMLFTVLVMSLILTIAIGISNITFKQTILSSLAKDSQIAFYQADRGVECGMYYDITIGSFPAGLQPSAAPNTITCGESTMELDDSKSATDYFVYDEQISVPAGPCTTIIFDKTDTNAYSVQSRGYNVCIESPRKVERLLEVIY